MLFVNSLRSLTAVLQETTETMPDSCHASTRRSGSNLLRLFLERGIAVEGETCENLRADLTCRPPPLPPVSYDDDDKLSRIVVLVRLVVIMEQLLTTSSLEEPQQPSLQQHVAG